MKRKFESNVATQVPQTQVTHEPKLPWEIRNEDFSGDEFAEDPARAMSLGKAPLGIQPIFLVAILILVFVSMLGIFIFIASTNQKAAEKIRRMEEEKLMLLTHLEESSNELETLEEKNIQLEENRNDLNIQNKELLSVIKALSTKSEGDGTGAPLTGGKPEGDK